MTGFDLHPVGELMASIDLYGACLVSKVDTGSYQSHFHTKEVASNIGWCQYFI